MRIRVRVMAPVERLGYARRTSRFQVRTGAQPEIAQGGFSLKGGIWIWHRDGVVHRLNGGADSKAPIQPVNNAGKAIHGFNRGLRAENGQSPGRRRAEAALWRAAKAGGAKEKMGLDRCVLSSLTGLVFYSRHNPAMNRRAIFKRPCGTWNHGTLNGYTNGRRYTVHPQIWLWD